MLPTASSLASTSPAKEDASDGQLPATGDQARAGRRASPDGLAGVFAPPANYHAYDVKEYRKLQQQYANQRWGGLGFVDSDEQKAAREKRARVFEYGKCVSQINAAILKAYTPEPDAVGGSSQQASDSSNPARSAAITRKLTEDGEIAKLKRDRAIHFFDKLTDSKWKLPVVKAPTLHASPSPSRDREPFTEECDAPKLLPEQREALDQLQDLMEKHRRDYDTMIRMKRELGMLSPSPTTV
jgi:hypothetical protein